MEFQIWFSCVICLPILLHVPLCGLVPALYMYKHNYGNYPSPPSLCAFPEVEFLSHCFIHSLKLLITSVPCPSAMR